MYSILGKMGEGGKDCNFLVISVRKINQTTNQPNPFTSTNLYYNLFDDELFIRRDNPTGEMH